MLRHLFLAVNFLAASAFAQSLPLPPQLPPIPVTAAQSAPTSIDVSFPYGHTIPDFARFILQDVLKQPFMFSEEFIASQERVGFEKKGLKPAAAEQLLRDVLSERGYVLTHRNGFFYITKKGAEQSAAKTDYVYRPRYRDLSYLSATLAPLFPAGAFTFQRSVGDSKSSSVGGGTSVTTGATSSSKPVDTGTSAFSQQSRGDLDAFVFQGTADDITRLKYLLSQLDVPVPRVMVRALVVEVGQTNDGGSSVSLVANVLSNRLQLSLGGGSLGNALTFKTPDISAVFSALSTDGRFNVRTSPALVAESGVSAKLQVGSSIPTLGAIQTLQGGQTQQSVSYQDVGTLLTITPKVLDSNISVQLAQEISDAVQTTTGVNATPTLNRRSLSTSLSLSSGEWALLGGLSSEKVASGASRLPFFNIPLGTTSQDAKTDIVILLYVERQ